MSVMTFEQCNHLMVETLEKYGSHASNKFFGKASDWTFRVENLNGDTLGICNFRKKIIALDSNHFEKGTVEELTDTVLHECAHALAGIVRTGKSVMVHGKLWKQWAVIVGAKPSALAVISYVTPAVERTHNYKYFIISVVGDDIEVHSGCKRRLVRLSTRYYSDKEYTRGNLYHIKVEDYERFKDQPQTIRQLSFR